VKTDLREYVQRVKLFSKDQYTFITEELDFIDAWREYPYNSPEDNICVQDQPDIVYYDCKFNQDEPLAAFVHGKINEAVDSYVNDFLKDLPWFSYTTGFGKVHFIKYPVGAGMGTHCDHVRNQFDGTKRGIPILTVLGCLSEYEGGEILFWEKDKIKLTPGEVLIFPANFLYPHEVLKVEKGTRYSFVNWIW